MKSSNSLHATTSTRVKPLQTFHVHTEDEMLQLGRNFAQQITTFPAVIELVGDVGAGKTTFTRGLAAGLGITEPVTSPSFTISKSYAFRDRSGTPRTLTHYDFYRLPDPGIMLTDLSDAIANDAVIIVEWGDSVKDILPPKHYIITLNYNDDNSRSITIQ